MGWLNTARALRVRESCERWETGVDMRRWVGKLTDTEVRTRLRSSNLALDVGSDNIRARVRVDILHSALLLQFGV